MIPCNELRIGNYILAEDRLHQVVSIDGRYVEADSMTGEGAAVRARHGLGDIRAASLTDDMLLQCGFVYRDYYKFWQRVSGQNQERSEMDIDRDYNIVDFMRRPVVKSVASLHQLQNIFFALTGRELTYVRS